ncbi:uncharacterized protein [Pyrus communis]|uniref:uncharacterized protein n=1 Tax=Pyrus communis TaxID=23211 RepID=UPI0035C1782D
MTAADSKADVSNLLFIHHSDHPSMMLELREHYTQSNVPHIFQLQQDIASLTQDQLSVTAYYTKLKKLWDELASYSDSTSCTCGAQNERNKLMQFLMGLNESYGAIRRQVLLMNPLPTVRQAYASISQEEKQRSLTASRRVTETTAMAVQQDGSQSSGSSSRKPLHCTHCDHDYHTIDTCYQLHGYPPGHHLHKVKPQKGSKPSKKEGNSSSSVNQVSKCATLEEMKSVMSELSNNQFQQILHIMNNKGGDASVPPKANVTAMKNLTTKTVIGLGKQRGGLYYLVALTPTTSGSPRRVCNLVLSPTELWHQRLGHL